MRLVSVLAIVMAVTGTAVGQAACNVVPPTRLGDGASAISGYTVSNVTYVLDGDPRFLEEVTFDLDAAASEVWLRLHPAGPWVRCDPEGGNSWSCKVGGQSVQSATELRVVAAQ
ncbi:MAG TPA: hypothetical protein VNL95_10105 [Dehalococcoidia bacterium]|nr:hypothetical protein [Dehalococcoidia bacterium]